MKYIGQKFNRLTILSFSHKDKRYAIYWKCKCDCGTIKTVRQNHLKRGDIKSCGCYSKEVFRKNTTTHGMRRTRFYCIWCGMKNRGLGGKNKNYNKNYNKKNITICNRWLKFENFRDDMYEDYLKHVKECGEKQTTIDRIDNDGDYEPSN